MDWYTPIARHIMVPIEAWRSGSRWPWYVQEFVEWEGFSAAEIAQRQWEKMRALLAHAYQNVPHYRRVFEERGLTPKDFRSPEDIALLPVLTKQEIRHYGQDMVARNIPSESLVDAASGGTTGLPMYFRRDLRCRDLHYAGMVAFARWYGIRPGDRQALVWGSPRDLPTKLRWRARAFGRLCRRPLTLNSFDITEAAMDRFARALRRWRPRMVRGYPHALEHFARYVEAEGIALTVPVVVCTAEPLSEPQRRTIARALNAEVFNEYGGRECGLIATECSRHRGLHVNAFSVYLEILADGRPAPPGTLGLLTATELDSYGMPFIRYDLGDVGRWATELCDCGRALPLLGAVEGRDAELLVSTDGTRISGCALWLAMARLDIPGQLQFLQGEDLSVEVRVVPEDGFSAQHQKAIQHEVRHLLGEGVQVTIRVVPAIPRAPSGKYVYSRSLVGSLNRAPADAGSAAAG